MNNNLMKSEHINEKYKIQYENLYPVISQCNIDYAILKGDVLSLMAYGETGHRTYKDIDILISKSNVEHIRELLIGNGFENRIYNGSATYRSVKRSDLIMYSYSHECVPFYKDIVGLDKPMKIDLNHNIYWSEYSGLRVTTEEFLSDFIFVDMYGYRFRTLSHLKSFVQVCIHQYKHLNTIFILAHKNSYTRKSFQDIYFFYERNIKNSISNFIDYVKKIELVDYLYVVLFYVSQIYDDNSLKDCVNELETESGKNMLDYYGLTKDERKKWKLDFFERLDNDDLIAYVNSEMTEQDKLKMSICLSQ